MKKTKKVGNPKPKKNAENMKKAENNILLVNVGIILYALILALIYNMSGNTATIDGADCILKILKYGGIIAAMAAAAYSAYVAKHSLLKYAFMCVFISVSAAVAAGPAIVTAHSYAIIAFALAVAFVFNIIYAIITERALYYENKKNRIIFRTAVGVTYGIILAFIIVRYCYLTFVR